MNWYCSIKLASKLIGYHGSNAKFDTFKPGQTYGYWFSTSPKVARRFGEHVTAYELNMSHMIDLNDASTFQGIMKQLPDHVPGAELPKSEVMEYHNRGGVFNEWGWQNAVLKKAHELGYDGAYIFDELEDGLLHDSYVVFSPSQAKQMEGSSPQRTEKEI